MGDRRRWRAPLVGVLWGCLLPLLMMSAGPLCASEFDFGVDRFEIDGNWFGPSDGIPDRVAEFDDYWLGPEWITIFGTARTGGGVLHLTSPGALVANGLGALPGTTLEISMVEFTQAVERGQGDFTARSYWVPTVLRVGDFVHFSLVSSRGDSGFAVVGIAISNATPDDLPTRYDVSQVSVVVGGGSETAPLATDSVSIDPAEVTGDVVLALSSDGTDAIRTSFSLDGGATFRTPFASQALYYGGGAHFLLGADPLGPGQARVRPFCPGVAPPTVRHGLRLRAGGARRPLVDGTLRAAMPATYDPFRDGVQIAVRDPASPETAVLDLTRANAVPGGAPGSGCDPRDGWHPGAGVYRYRNFSDALPPACVPGSAGGLARLRIDRGRNRIAFRTRRAMVLPGGPIAATVAFGASSDAATAGRCVSVDATCTEAGRTLRCR